ARDLHFPAERCEVSLPVLHFHPWCVILVPQAEIHRQRIGYTPVVLEIGGKHVRSLSPCSCAQSTIYVGRKSQEEISLARAAAIAGLCQSIGPRRELSGEVHTSRP